MKKSQAWSMDIMIAAMVFIGAIFVIYTIFTGNHQESTAEELEKDASKVLKRVSSEDPDVGIMDGIEVDEAKLQQLLGEDYNAIKEKIRTSAFSWKMR